MQYILQEKIIGPILDLIFPHSCIGCGASNTPWCESCFSTIRQLETQTCYICRKPSKGGVTCANHTVFPTTLNALLVACPYNANPLLKKAIHALKYQRRSRTLAGPLGTFLAQTMSMEESLKNAFSQRSPAIIPIPLHETREEERGFNQAQLLAVALERQVQQPMAIRNDILIRTRPTLPQTESREREQRLQNLKNAFATRGSIDPSRTYLLLDDVCATCATLEDACRALREAGAREVWGMVLARN